MKILNIGHSMSIQPKLFVICNPPSGILIKLDVYITAQGCRKCPNEVREEILADQEFFFFFFYQQFKN